MKQPGFAFAVRCTVLPQDREAFVNAINEHAAKSVREEPGTIRFDVAVDTTNATNVYLYEAYEDRAAFDAHFAAMLGHAERWTPYFAAPPERLCVGIIVPHAQERS